MYVLLTPKGMLSFTLLKRYPPPETVATYFALQEPTENITVFCRELMPSEKEIDFKGKLSYIVDTKNKNDKKPCIILFKVDSIEQADYFANSYTQAVLEFGIKFGFDKTEKGGAI